MEISNERGMGTVGKMCIRDSPYTQQLGGEDFDIQEYLRGLFNTLLLHDVVARLKINDVMILQDIVRYIMANVGRLLSPNKIAKSLVSAGRKIDNKTVERYLQGLQDSLLLYKVNRYDVRGKELLRINAKYYSVDATLRNLIVGSTGRDTGHILENIVFLDLIRRGYTVYVGQLAKGEIDFVAEKAGITEYYPVSYTHLDVYKRQSYTCSRDDLQRAKYLVPNLCREL